MQGPTLLEVARLPSPIGELTLFVREAALCAVAFEGGVPTTRAQLARRFGEPEEREAADPAGLVTRLRDYFDGDLGALEAFRVNTGGTPFQEAVWQALRRIPAGEVISYAELARIVERPRAVRAVGAANGRNPVPIVVPCHRVVASDGTLHGYGGGLERKRWLLDHEGVGFPAEAQLRLV